MLPHREGLQMAIVNFFDDILSEVTETRKVKNGQKLQSIINKYIEEKDAISVPYEVYDVESGNTSYITPETKEFRTLCLLNGNEQTDLEYKVKGNDIVSFIVIPEDSTQQWVNYLGGGLAIAGGVLLSVFTSGVGATIGAGLIYTGIGMVASQGIQDIIDYSSDSSSYSKKQKNDTMKEAENTLGLSDGSNQNILNHKYPILLGKHLLNPYTAGSAFNTTLTGENGANKGHYLTKLYEIADSPVKITDLKLGETMLAYNRTFEDTIRNSVMHGMLRGYNDADTGDILKKWKNNDVSVEILQAGTLLKDNENRYGTLYPQTVEQKKPDANILNIKDGDIKKVAERSYMGTSIPNGFKTNSVRFSRSCPQKIEVEFSFPNGLYAYRTRKEDGKIFYYNVPVSFAIQWRFIKKNQKSSDADSPAGWNNFDYIDVYDGQDIKPSYYTKNEKLYEYNSLFGKRDYLKTSNEDSMSEFFLKDKFINTEIFNLNGRYTSKDNATFNKAATIKCLVGLRKHNGVTVWSTNEVLVKTTSPTSSFSKNQILTSSSKNVLVTQPRLDPNTRIATSSGGKWVDNALKPNDFNEENGWTVLSVTEIIEADDYDAMIQVINNNTDDLSKHEISRDDINVSARSYVAVKEFTPNECAELIGYHNDSDEHLDSVEVRVLRLTPAYFQEYTWKDSDSGDSHTISDEWTAMSYCDLMKWDYLRTFAFDKDKFKESLDDGSISLHEKGEDKQVMRKLPLRPIKDDDLNRFCYVAIKLKQDIAETAGKSLNQFSCIAQNLAPNYDTQSGNWVPAVISPKTNNYHKYLNSSKDYKIEDISEQEYLDALRQRKTVTLFIDGTDVTTNTVKSNITRYYLSEKGLEYSKLNNPGKDYIFNIDGTDYPVDLTNIYTDDTNRTIINGLYITTGKGDSYDGVFIKKTDNATHSVYIYKKDSSIKPSEYYQTADGNNFSEQLKKEIFNYSTLSNSSVDADILYTNRPMVYGSKLQQNGFTDAEPDKKYWVFAKKYTNENILNSKYPTYAIVVTPIKPDGTVLTKTELDTAANRLLRGQSDTDKILLASFKPVYAIRTGLSQSGKVYYYTSSVGNAANGADDYSLSEQADQYIQIQEKLQEIYNNQESEYYEKLSALSAKTPENIQTEDIEKYATNIGLSYDFSSVDSGTIDFYKKKILRILYRTTFIEALKQMGLVTLDESKSAKFYLPEYIEKKYCSQNVASQFLYALVGPALGIDAKTYDCVNMNSVKELYIFCEDVTDGTKKKNSNELLHMKFSCNGVVSSEIKFETLLKNILLTGRSSLKRDEKNRYEVLLGKPTDYPVGVLNQQNIISKSNTRSLANEISGYLAEFTDETDNYTRNSLYVMNDGEDYRKPTKEISSIFINYVTNREQLYSLLRYNLCTVLYQKESYSYTVGSIGYALSVGDVLLIQDDSLLVGKESGARITSLITSNDGNYLYGITVDSPIEFSGKPGFGCTIVQPEKYQASRCITLEFCDKNGILVDSDKNIKLTPEIGLTNTLYFKEPIYLGSGTDSETGKVIQIVPKIGNLVAFGNLKAITEKGLVLSISPKDNGQFDIRLVPYRPELYNMGTKMPVFTANMTIPSREEEEFVFSDKTSAYDQEQKVADATASLTEKIDAISKDIDVTPPTSPVLTEAVSDDNGNITLVWNGSTDNKSGVSEYCIYHKTVGRFVRIQTIPHDNNSQAQYTFTHNTSEKFTTHYYYVTAKDKMNNESEPSETLSIENPVKTKPYEPKALKAMAMRDYIRLEWTCEQSTNASLNPRLFKVEIKRNDTEEWESVGEYSSRETLYYFDRSKDGYSEADKISKYQFRVKSVSVYELESEYCTSESVNVDNYLGWKIGDIEISSYATEGTLFIKASVKGSSYGDKFLNVKYGDEIVAENSLAGRMFYVKLNGYQEVSDITSKDIYVECYSVADNVSKTLAGSNIDTSLYKTYKITKPSVTAYADKQGIHISWSDNTGDYYLKPAYKLTIDGKEVLSAADTLDYSWLFAENTYPTKAEVLAHKIILSVSTAADSVEISDIAIDISVFKGWIPDVPDIKLSVSGRTVPISWNIQSDNVYDFLGCELQVAKGYKVTAGKYSVITDESELEWFAPALGLNPYESLNNYKKGDKDGYLSVKGSSVAFSVPLFGQDNDGAMNTMYVYRARAFTKGGKSEWSDAYFIEVKPVSAYDVVKAWNINDSGEKVKIDGALGANQIFVNELSAICANLGYITDGALQGDQYNYWAVNDTVLKDGSILNKGAFRVGGVNKYIKVIPKVENGAVIDYDVELHVGDFSMSATGTLIEGGYFTVKDSKSNVLFQLTPEKAMIQVNEGTYNSNELIDIYASNATTSPTELRTAENYHWFDSKLYFAEVTENSSSSYTISVYEVSGKTTALKRTLNAVTKDYWFQDGYIYYNSTTTILFKKKNCIKKTKISNGSNTNYTDLGNKPDFTEIAYFGDYIMYLDDSDSDNKLLYLYNLTTNTKSESFNASNKTISIAAATDDSNYIYVMLTASFVTIFLRFSKSNMTWEVTGSTFIPRGDVSEFSKNLQIKDGGITVFCRFGFFPTNTSTANQEGIVMLENPMFEFANNLDNLSAISNITIYGNDVSSSEADKSVYIPIYSNDNKIYVQNLEDYCIYSVDKFLSESEVECYGAVWKGSVSYKKVQSLSEKNGEIGNTITACCCFSFKDEQEDNNSFLFCGLKVFQNTETSGYNEVCVVGSYESEQYNKKTKAVYETGIGFTGIYFNSLNNTYRYVTDTGAYLEFDENGKLITAKGETGATGPQGKPGQSAGFGDITASVDDNTGIPKVTVTTKGFDSKKYIDFAFKNLKGKQGEPGVSVVKVEQIETSTENGGTNKIRITLSNGSTSDFVIKNGNSSTIDADHFEGTLPVSKGGTGATTAQGGFNALADGLVVDEGIIYDDETFLRQNRAGSTWKKYKFSKLWDYIKGKISSVLGLTASSYGGTASAAAAKKEYTLDLSSLSTSNFYPVIFKEFTHFSDVAVNSQSFYRSAPYNQNRIHFLASFYGWSDTPKSLNILEYGCFDTNEITIGCIGCGLHNGDFAIWLRGGRRYYFYCLDATPTLMTSDYTNGDQKFTVGTNYYGGNNVNVAIVFTPQSTISIGAYISSNMRVNGAVRGSTVEADSRLSIPQSAPSSPQNGDIWIE